VDKRELARRVADAGLPAVPTQRFADPRDLARQRDTLPPVAVVKPAVQRFPARVLRAGEPLPVFPPGTGELLVQPFLDDPLRAIAGVVRGGRLVAAVHQRYVRTWPTPAGTASAAETVAADLHMEQQLIEVLEDYDGVFQFQLAGDYVLDLNARVYGSLPLAVAAGVNLPALACDNTPPTGAVLRARVGVAYRWLEGDVRHLWHRWRTGDLAAAAAIGALRPRLGTAHSVESLRDPLPMVVRLVTAVRRRG
jgi:predicted ATP-grasp superfamily ATP-dependent carboligase